MLKTRLITGAYLGSGLGACLSLALVLGAALPTAARAQQAADGEGLFRQRCGSCHSLEPGQNRIGPDLAGIIGRPAGQVEGARYSEGMQRSGIVWDEASLDQFMADPRQMVPGTTMTVRLPNAGQRRAIIQYLKTVPGK